MIFKITNNIEIPIEKGDATHLWHITEFVTWVTRCVLIVDQELL